MKRCLPLPQRFARDYVDHKDRTGNLERKDGGECGYQRADCGADANFNHYYRFEEGSGNFQDESGSADLVELGSGLAITRLAPGVDSKCIQFDDADWHTLYAATGPNFPQYTGGLFDMSSGSFGIGCHVWPSSSGGTDPIGDAKWVPLVGQDSGETTTGDYMGMLWYNWDTNEVAVCFNHYQFHTASKDGNPRDQFLNGHFKIGTAVLTENAWNRVLWVHDDTAGGTEKLYVNSPVMDSSFASEDAGAVADENFRVGQTQWADGFLAQFFGAAQTRGLGGGSRIDNVAVWEPAYGAPTSDDITQFMSGNGGGNLAENGSWVITSGHEVAKVRVKKNGA